MLSCLRVRTLNAYPGALKSNSIAYRCFCNLSYMTITARRNNADIAKKSKKESFIKESTKTDAFTFTQKLAFELENVKEYKEYVDTVILEKIETILKKHNCEEAASLNKILKEHLNKGLLQEEAFDSVNKNLANQIGQIISKEDFTIHYPSHELITLFALFTNKVFTYLEMMFSNSKNNTELTSGDFLATLANNEAYITAKALFGGLMGKNEDINLMSKTFYAGWLKYSEGHINKTVDSIRADNTMLETIKSPLNWFPKTKIYKRKFFLHVGPTNSGKTYTALNLLKKSRSRSFYAGPLRLLAKEIFDKFNYEYKIPCNLLTGEKVINVIDPSTGGYANISAGTTDYIARTIESQKEYDIVVVDEAQLINEEFRGGAVMNIIFGCRAKQIHLCGEPRLVSIVKRLCELMNDDVEVIQYDRRSRLKLAKNSMPHLSKLKTGDCLIDSSRVSILRNKARVEYLLKKPVATIYGGQPLSIRAFQAYLFNTRQSPILVASNAIGIGMNLNIDQIVFNTLKRGGIPHSRIRLQPAVYFPDADIKQMAGRAGRNKSFGTVTTLLNRDELKSKYNDHERLSYIFHKENDPIEEVFVSPPMRILSKMFEIFKRNFDLMYGVSADKLNCERAYHDHLADVKFDQLMEKEKVDLLMLKHQKGPTLIYDVLADMDNMTFLEKTTVTFIPLKVNNRIEMEFLKTTARLLNKKEVVSLNNCGIPFERMLMILRMEVVNAYATKERLKEFEKNFGYGVRQNLQDVECISRCLTGLLWLNTRYPNRIVNISGVEDLLIQCDLIMHYISEVESKTYDKEDEKLRYKNRSRFLKRNPNFK